jgi:hypothetical protein
VLDNNGNLNSELFMKSLTGPEETILEPALAMPLPHVNRKTAFDNTLRHNAAGLPVEGSQAHGQGEREGGRAGL